MISVRLEYKIELEIECNQEKNEIVRNTVKLG